jgi:hypothetical protein
MEPIQEIKPAYTHMVIMEKYEKVIDYLYPLAQSMHRKHGVARDMFLKCLFDQVELIYEAGKSNQVSKLYLADANLANLRFWLRFLETPKVKGITPNQHRVALTLIAEVGKMLGTWISNRKG